MKGHPEDLGPLFRVTKEPDGTVNIRPNPELVKEPEGEAHARHSDPDTSHDAADSISGNGATRLENIVLHAVREAGASGANAWELQQATGLPNETLTPRLAPLRRKGLIRDSGTKRNGRGTRKQIVWVAE